MSKGVALVTGAGQGIGRAIALRLAADGYDIAVNDIPANKESVSKVVEEVKSTGRRAYAAYADVSKDAEVAALVDEVVGALGSVDVAVANAGISILKPIFDLTVDEFDRVQSVNLRGTFLTYKYAAKQMVKQGRGGRIIGACSNAGKKGIPGLSAYSASKFGVKGLTQSAAQEFGPLGITVNAFAPGPVKTAMHASNEAAFGIPAGGLDEELKKQAALRDFATTDDVAALVSFFASDNAKIITGQCINVDGGREFD
ncbi:acetoin reductase family protein [Auriscalpium vulgare]|uniref:Acetoin reductase family protein n=1 Tax=Auriscalpium vulgare TaxID=40419 RepID=A0ACB8S022_9AGAM|nr:acetoin reductase family protein [Auriscalpium vulgare]